MKKMYTLAVFILSIGVINAQSFTQLWRKTAQAGASDLPWFNNTSGFVRSIAYNPATNKLYATLTSGSSTGDSIFIFNANTGNVEGKLRRDGVGIGTEPFKNVRIRVSDDGAIFSSSISVVDPVNANIQRCKIYRWASEADSATLAVSFLTSERCGDALGVTGTGINTKLYVAGPDYARDYTGVRDSTAQKIYILSTIDGLTFTKTDSVRIMSIKTSGRQAWIRSLDPIGPNVTDGFWVNNQNRSVTKLNVTGTPGAYTASIGLEITSGVSNGQASSAYGSVKYLQTPGNKKYIAMAGAWFSGITATTNSSVVMRMLDVTDPAAVTTVGNDTLRGVNNIDTLLRNSNNVNSFGDVAYKQNGDGSYDVFYLSANNGIACTRSATTLPVELSKFTAQLVKNNVKLIWATASEINNAGFEVEKSISGEKFAKIGFLQAKGNSQNNYEFIDINAVNTKASEVYYRLKQTDKDGKFSYSNVEVVKMPSKNIFTAATFENPFNNQIKLQVGVEKESIVSINITNVKGQLVKSTKASLQKGNNNITIIANDFASGQYFITLTNGSVNQTLSVIKN